MAAARSLFALRGGFVPAVRTPHLSCATRDMSTRTPAGHKIGTVISNKMDKSIVVQVDRRYFHPLYKHFVKRRKKFMAHDELEQCAPGDVVQISPCKPRSKRKRWDLETVLKKADTME